MCYFIGFHDISYDSYDIITGHGDRNTKLVFKLKTIGDSRGSIWDIDCKIIPVDGDIFYTDKTHSVTLIETDYMEKLYRLSIKINYHFNFKILFIHSFFLQIVFLQTTY